MYMGAGARMIRDTHADGLFERAELYLKRYATEHRHYLHHQWEDEKKRKSKVGKALREVYFIPTKPDDVRHRSVRQLEMNRKFELKHGDSRSCGVRAEPCSWSMWWVDNWSSIGKKELNSETKVMGFLGPLLTSYYSARALTSCTVDWMWRIYKYKVSKDRVP